MTFRKKDPELVTLHFLTAEGKLKPSAYRVKKHADFTKCLQVSTASGCDCIGASGPILSDDRSI